MKIVRLMFNLFDVKYFYGMRNFNCEFMFLLFFVKYV